MRFAGIDIGGERHMVAIVDQSGAVILKATPVMEDASGYERLLELLGSASDCLVAMEATGHYWRNLFTALVTAGFKIALINPLRSSRFAEEELQRTKTDAIDALGIARFAAQKRPRITELPDPALQELRELVRLKEHLVQQFGDRVRQLHRAVDLGFPEFTRHIRALDSELATALLTRYPTAAALRTISVRRLARLCYDGSHHVGEELARTLLEAAKHSVGAHHGEPYQLQVRYACEDLEVLRQRLRSLDRDVERRLEQHEVGKLLSGRTMARTGLRMMPTFPSSSLRFRTAGFPQYGSKAGLSDGACPRVAWISASRGLHPSFVPPSRLNNPRSVSRFMAQLRHRRASG